MGLFSSWGDFTSGLYNGIQDVGSWVGTHGGEILGIAKGINDLTNPTDVQAGKAPSGSSGNLYAPIMPPWMSGGTALEDSQKIQGAGQGSIVGTLLLFTTALVVVVLIAKR